MNLRMYLYKKNIKVKDFIKIIQQYKEFEKFNYMNLNRYINKKVSPRLSFVKLVRELTNNEVSYEDWK